MEIYYASVLRSNSHLKIPKNCNLEFDFHSLYLEPVRTRLCRFDETCINQTSFH